MDLDKDIENPYVNLSPVSAPILTRFSCITNNGLTFN